jgi:hypothetical protein
MCHGVLVPNPVPAAFRTHAICLVLLHLTSLVLDNQRQLLILRQACLRVGSARYLSGVLLCPQVVSFAWFKKPVSTSDGAVGCLRQQIQQSVLHGPQWLKPGLLEPFLSGVQVLHSIKPAPPPST